MMQKLGYTTGLTKMWPEFRLTLFNKHKRSTRQNMANLLAEKMFTN